MTTAPRRRKARPLESTTGGGKPMTESGIRRENVRDLLEILGDRFADDPTLYISAEMLIYYQEGDPIKCVEPDIFVVRGVPKHPRDCYLIWEEGKGPDLVIELTSKAGGATIRKNSNSTATS